MEPQGKEAFELHLALACQLGEVMGRLRERRIASQPEQDRNTPPEVAARAAAFNDSMRARELETLEAVQHESWWDTAQQHDVCNMLALSSTWKNVSDAAATADAYIRDQLASREIDEELTAALRAHREAWSEYTADSVRHRGQQVAGSIRRGTLPRGGRR